MLRHRLTPEVRLKILNGIRAGGYAHVAGEAWGIPPALLDSWLQQGSRAKAREPYRSFAWELHEAEAQARLQAEIQVFQADPKIWLEHGPGRETAAARGWTSPVKAADASTTAENFFLNPQATALLGAVLSCLEKFPQARAEVADAIANSNFPLPKNAA